MKPLPPLAAIDRLLIVKTSSFGDVIHALPVAQALKDACPDVKLDWVVRQRCADILRGNPNIGLLYVLENKPTFGELARLRQALCAARYEVALDMQGLFLSGLVTALSGAPIRVGWDRNREANALFLTHPVVPGKSSRVGVRHEIDLLSGFARALGVESVVGIYPPQPYLAAEDAGQAAGRLRDLPRPRLALNVGAARAYKRWPTEHWIDLAGALLEDGLRLVFVGDTSDTSTVAAIRSHLPPDSKMVDVSGQTTLRELAAVLSECDLVVSGDTGPMHLAVAVGTPVVALFGATDPRRHGPYGDRNTVIFDAASVTASRPTEEQGAAAMRAILPASVLAAVQVKLAERPHRLAGPGGVL